MGLRLGTRKSGNYRDCLPTSIKGPRRGAPSCTEEIPRILAPGTLLRQSHREGDGQIRLILIGLWCSPTESNRHTSTTSISRRRAASSSFSLASRRAASGVVGGRIFSEF